MKSFIIPVILFCGFHLFGQEVAISYEEVNSFFKEVDQINKQDIEWGMLTVPENWESPYTRKIKLAVARLKNTANIENAEAVVMIEGGPGAGAIEGIWWWLNHSLRKTHDIVLMDIRGAGFSEPRLCPDLGKELLKILAKDQSSVTDEQEKAEAALRCKQDLLARGIDVKHYQSNFIAQDLHALKEYFEYSQWNVYGVSYGTYIAQIYAKDFPKDVKTLILDSPISNINEYYTLNTSNYVNSLEKVFKQCREDPECNSEYPDLKTLYNSTLKALKENPITVKVDKEIVPGGEFTYNVEDFKIAVHQALYQKRLVEVLPLLIDQFHKRNEDTLSALVAAFSGALGLDYGVYYCMTCNEAIPRNKLKAYFEDVKSQELLNEGLSFYKSDFIVCDMWNKGNVPFTNELDTLIKKTEIPILIFTGEFDPITPAKNGKELRNEFNKAQLIEANSYGHASSFTRIGYKKVTDFINDPNKEVENHFEKLNTNFVENIHINGGISRMGNSLNKREILFFIPLIIALLVSLGSIFIYVFSFLRKKRNQGKLNTIIKILLVISSILSILIIVGAVVGLNNTASENFYILAFGLPQNYSFVFKLLIPFMISLSVASLIFLLGMKYIENRSILFTVLFSNILIAVYLFFWGVI